jgi:hypothetical protein
MADLPVSSEVFLSRDEIRNQMIEQLKLYLEMENVDLTKSSFLSYLIDVLSVMTSNLLFYQISTYKEFFLTKAQLPESIYNLSAFLGYVPKFATSAQASVLFTLPLTFTDNNVSFTIPYGWKATATGNISFLTTYLTTVTVTNNSSVEVVVRDSSRKYDIPVIIENGTAFFVLTLNQIDVSVQETKIPSTLQLYQFHQTEVSFSGQISGLVVEVQEPQESVPTVYTEFSSLYLMTSIDKGYVVRRSDAGLIVSFGNGLIGYQPKAGSIVTFTITLTEGEDGNVISGSITNGERIYTTVGGVTQIVEYSVTNTTAAVNGKNEESLEETRRNAIINLTALKRTVSESDYKNANIIIDDSPIGANSLPVLKRSDLKVNEITLFTTLLYNNGIVPTRDIFYEFPISSTIIPKNTLLSFDGLDYYTLFDMEIEELNSVANYYYVLNEISQVPILSSVYDVDYDPETGKSYSNYEFKAENFIVIKDGTSGIYELALDYTSYDDSTAVLSAEMEILQTGNIYPMTNDGTAFTVTFLNYNTIPTGKLDYFITIARGTTLIAKYQASLVFRQSLENYTMSDVVYDSSTCIVYDIPVVEKNYYDSINKVEFESQVLQKLLTTLSFKDYRMLTDFVSLKFSNTTGLMKSMLLNDVNHSSVIDILHEAPVSPALNSRYIASSHSTGFWAGKDHMIATCVDSSSVIWSYKMPVSDDMVFVENRNTKYIFGEYGWVEPIYDIPLKISLEVFKSATYSGSVSGLSYDVKQAILNAFSDRFGIGINIFRSELIDIVQEVDGVDHCHVVEPQSSVFFNFDINEFTQEELLKYAPDYIYFDESSISIKILSMPEA